MSNELVAQRGEDDAADEAARERRVEHVGVFGEADRAASALGLRQQQRRQQAARDGEAARDGGRASWRGLREKARQDRSTSDAASAVATNADCRRSRRCRCSRDRGGRGGTTRRRRGSRARSGTPTRVHRRIGVGFERRHLVRAARRARAGSACGSGSPTADRAGSARRRRAAARSRRAPGSGSGIADSSACVYGCRGSANSASCRRDLDDAAEVHHRDARRDVLDDREVVRDEEVREAEAALQVLQQVDDLRLHRHVERRHRPRRRRSASARPRARARCRCAGAGRPRTRADSAARAAAARPTVSSSSATRSRRRPACRPCSTSGSVSVWRDRHPRVRATRTDPGR